MMGNGATQYTWLNINIFFNGFRFRFLKASGVAKKWQA